MIKQRQGIKNSNENCDFFFAAVKTGMFLLNITLEQIELKMPDTTQMEAILKSFPNVIDFISLKSIQRI